MLGAGDSVRPCGLTRPVTRRLLITGREDHSVDRDGVTGGGDLFGMFNDTPQAQSMIQYLLTPEAQQIWVELGGFISANKNVPLDAYPDEVSRRSAEILANAKTFRFDAGDLMPSALSAAPRTNS